MPETFDFEPDLMRLRRRQGIKWTMYGPDVIPAWVADMDFDIAPPIRAALDAVLDRQDLGYPHHPFPPASPLASAFSARMESSFGWPAEPEHVRTVNELVQALQVILHLVTEPGDGIVLHTPAYPPFVEAAPELSRRLIEAPLDLVDGEWTWDHADLRRRVAAEGARVLVLVNPHNPTGRVFRRDELLLLADLAEEFDLVVVSDEIHAELTYDGHQHVPFAALGPAAAARTVTLTSATKAWNLGGVSTGLVHLGDERVRKLWDALPPMMFGLPNVFGVEATLAAWRDCDAWLAQLKQALHARRQQVVNRVESLHGISTVAPQGTYLAWLDCREIDATDALHDRLRRAGVELGRGPDFGDPGAGFARLNFATSSAVLGQVLDRLGSVTD